MSSGTEKGMEAEPERDESIGSLFSESPREEDKRGGDSRGVLFRMLGWVAALALLALAVVRIWKKMSSSGRSGLESGGLRVVGRTALTPRHFLYAVRVGNHRLLVVGVSGDRVSPITEFDEPAQVLSLDPAFQKTLQTAGAQHEVDKEGEGRGSSFQEPSHTEGLSPYRQEVKRLVDVVRGWRIRMGQTFGSTAESRK